MKEKAILIIDRGSREKEVENELIEICSKIKQKSDYVYSSYCFLEVRPPFIREGIEKCISHGAKAITIMPLFLYPGLKLKESVNASAKFCYSKNIQCKITKPLSYHPLMRDIIIDRIKDVKILRKLDLSDKECDVLLIGHGSRDKSARRAFIDLSQSLEEKYRKVNYCFLELDVPNIENGIRSAINNKPKVLILMTYFLHKGAHIKHDIIQEVEVALEKFNFCDAYLTSHIGPDEKLVDIIIDRSKEAEKGNGIN